MATVKSRVYVAGDTSRANRAVANLQALCEASVGADDELGVIDVLQHEPDGPDGPCFCLRVPAADRADAG